MQRGYTNKFNAYQGVKGFLVKNRSVYGRHLVVVELVEQFNALLDEIVRVSARAVYGTKQYTKSKYERKTEMAKLASSLGAAGMVYAIEKDDTDMKRALKWSYSKIRFATDSEALLRANGIERKLRIHQTVLAHYLVSEEDVETLRSAIDDFETTVRKRGAEKADNVTAHIRLKELFKETDNHLYNKLDRIMLRIGNEHPDFYKSYREARKIDDLR